ncbi:hypothetical protein BH09PLA1_BH09PLA1_14280 [soil metagenome]
MHAGDILVANQSQFTSALNTAQPGDSIVLKNGVWSNLNVNKQNLAGTRGAPITIRAQTPGQVAITGPNYFFDVGGHDYVVTGLTFKDENSNLKSVRFRGTNSRAYDNALLVGGRYNQITYDVTDSAINPTSSFDHNFMSGKQDRGTMLVLDLSLNAHINNNYFGHRPSGGPSGQTNGWETIRIGNSGISDQTLGSVIENNYFESSEGEAETISDKTQNNIIRGNTFKTIRKGWVTARLGGGGVYENNTFIDALGIRVGNNDDTIPDHPGLIIRNNYVEGPNAKILLPGYQTNVTIEGNTVVTTAGSYNGFEYTTGKMPFEYSNTTNGTINNNVFTIGDGTYGAVKAATLGSITPSATGTGNFAYNSGTGPTFASGTPAAIQNLFTAANPQLIRDSSGLLRPSATGPAAGKGYQGTTTVLTRVADVGPSWLDPVMRMNKFTAADFRFNGEFGGTLGSAVQNNGYLSTPATLQNSAGTATDLHSGDSLGTSGRIGDRAFDNRATSSMGASGGGKAVVADRTWFRDLQAFTIAGWFKTDGAQTIGSGAVLMSQLDGNGGWSLGSTTAGKLTLTVDAGGSSKTATSSTSFSLQNAWTFFAVTFDARPSGNEVQFYVGSETSDVASAGAGSISSSNSSDTVLASLTIGDRFDGLLDNMRLFTARKDITWINDDGTTYTRAGNNHDFALLNLSDLQTLRAFDLGINQWNVDADGLWSNNNNWLPNSPDGVDQRANFTKAVTAQRTVIVDSPQTVGSVRFGAGSYSVEGGATLTLQTSRGVAAITLGSPAQTIAAPIRLLSDTTISGNATLTLGHVSAVAGTTLSVQSPVVAGSFDSAGSVSVAAGSRVSIGNTGGAVSRIATLVLTGGATPTATLDLADRDLLLTSTNRAVVESQIGFARHGGAWDRAGITSIYALTNVQHSTTLGVMSGTEFRAIYSPNAAFDGILVADADVLVKYTWYGDADFNGLVNFDDYARIDNGFNGAASGWVNGDFDLNGVVNFDDYALIDLAFNVQSGSLRGALHALGGSDDASLDAPAIEIVRAHAEQFGAGYQRAFLRAVPEPGSALIAALASGAIARRRRR